VKLSRHVADKGRPFASQVLAPSGQLEPTGTISDPTSTSRNCWKIANISGAGVSKKLRRLSRMGRHLLANARRPVSRHVCFYSTHLQSFLSAAGIFYKNYK
jgi:hypothetical protein